MEHLSYTVRADFERTIATWQIRLLAAKTVSVVMIGFGVFIWAIRS